MLNWNHNTYYRKLPETQDYVLDIRRRFGLEPDKAFHSILKNYQFKRYLYWWYSLVYEKKLWL